MNVDATLACVTTVKDKNYVHAAIMMTKNVYGAVKQINHAVNNHAQNTTTIEMTTVIATALTANTAQKETCKQ